MKSWPWSSQSPSWCSRFFPCSPWGNCTDKSSRPWTICALAPEKVCLCWSPWFSFSGHQPSPESSITSAVNVTGSQMRAVSGTFPGSTLKHLVTWSANPWSPVSCSESAVRPCFAWWLPANTRALFRRKEEPPGWTDSTVHGCTGRLNLFPARTATFLTRRCVTWPGAG